MQQIKNYHIKNNLNVIKDMILFNRSLNLLLLYISSPVFLLREKLMRKGLRFKLRRKLMSIIREREKILMCMGRIEKITLKCLHL